MHKKGGAFAIRADAPLFSWRHTALRHGLFHEYYCQKAVFFLIILKNQKKYFILHGKAKIA